MVIVDAQRMGPATGAATTVAQGDIQFLRWGTSGGYPVIVLAPSDVPECYTLTLRAFDLAERFRAPVFIATDKETVLSRSTVDTESLREVVVRQRRLASEDAEFVPYRPSHPGEVPAMSPFGGPHILRFTTSTHDERGYLTKKPADVGALNTRLAAKIEQHLDEVGMVEVDHDEGADTLVVSYGVSARSAKEAVRRARREGRRLSAATVHSLWPVPERQLQDAMAGLAHVVVAELNLGQYRREIERLADPHQEVTGVHRVDGELISPDEILRAARL